MSIGIQSLASGWISFATGNNSIASGSTSASFGTGTTASNLNSFAIGQATIASSPNSFAGGNASTATGNNSAAFGDNVKTIGNNSIAGGHASTATGSNSAAFGDNTKTIGNSSIAFGYSTVAKSFGTLAIGMFNDTSGTNPNWSNGTDPAFVIGNGWSASNLSNAFTVLQNGKTGIGNALPTEMLDVSGNARFRSVKSGGTVSALYIDANGVLSISSSDESLKHNFIHITGALDKVKEMNGLYYSWKNDPRNNRKLGFIAQEMEKIVPEAVFTNPTDGLKGINYAELTAVLAEAIKEQQQQIETIQNENQSLKNQNEELLKRLEKIEQLMGQKEGK
jgi:hypothetical protein